MGILYAEKISIFVVVFLFLRLYFEKFQYTNKGYEERHAIIIRWKSLLHD